MLGGASHPHPNMHCFCLSLAGYPQSEPDTDHGLVDMCRNVYPKCATIYVKPWLVYHRGHDFVMNEYMYISVTSHNYNTELNESKLKLIGLALLVFQYTIYQ